MICNGRDVELSTISDKDFLKFKLTNTSKLSLSGAMTVYYNSESVIVFGNNGFLQFRVVEDIDNKYLRIDAFDSDTEICCSCGDMRFGTGYKISYPVDSLSLDITGFSGDGTTVYKGDTYKKFCTFGMFDIIVITDKDSNSIISVHVIDGIFEILLLNLKDVRFSFMTGNTCSGLNEYAVSLVNQFRNFKKQIGVSGLYLMQSLSGDSLIIANNNDFMQFMRLEHCGKYCLKVESSCRDLFVVNDYGKLRLSDCYLMSDNFVSDLGISFAFNINNGKSKCVTYKGIDYLMWCSPSEMDIESVNIQVNIDIEYEDNSYRICLCLTNGKFDVLRLWDFVHLYAYRGQYLGTTFR